MNDSATATVRLVPSHRDWRLVELADLTPGQDRIVMLDRDQVVAGYLNPATHGTAIRIDDLRQLDGRPVVFYHCVRRPAWDGQCFVPVAAMTADTSDPTRDSYYDGQYWIPIN